MSSKAVIREEVPDFKYGWWTRLPNIVLSKVDDPYEGWLLFVIRKVAGNAEDGVCYMSIRTLAELAKMGRSTVVRKIQSLREKGLIRAEKKTAPRGWKVWHISIPRSLWEENEQAYRELSQRQPEILSVPEITREVSQGQPESVPETTVTKNPITKNPSTKKVSVHEKDEQGRYLERNPGERCSECGQFQRQCYCVPEGSRGKELDAATL